MDHYIQSAFKELFQEDGLIVMGRGLGVELLYSKFVQYFSSKPTQPNQHRLVFCINATGYEESLINLLLAEGAKPNELPKIINNEVNSTERSEMYQEGGCYFITSRILIVDLLDNKVDPQKISGMLIFNAHRISETSIESFVIRVYREQHRSGFIKAFCEDPESLQHNFGKIDRLLKVLFVRRLYLWPRFRLEITKALESHTTPNVIELSLSLTKHMKAIQSAILVAMNTCVNELKKTCTQLDTTQLTLENGLFHSFDQMIRSQLDPDWHRIPFKSKQMITDMSTLRKLLDYLIRYDAFSFYYLLLKLQQSSSEQTYPSLWLTSEAANKIFQHAKERVYSIQGLQMNCSWKKNATTTHVVDEVLGALQLEHVLEPVLECPPKWNVLLEILKEIKEDYQRKSTVATTATATSSTAATSTTASTTTLQTRNINGRVLLIVRDELAMTQLRDLMVHGSRYVMDQRFRWFVSQQSADIRKRSMKTRTTTINKNAAMSKAGVKTTLDTSIQSTATEFEFNERLVGELLSTSSSSNLAEKGEESEGYLGLGLPEKELKGMAKESQLVLIQELILRMTSPIQSIAATSSSSSSSSTTTNKRSASTSATDKDHSAAKRLKSTHPSSSTASAPTSSAAMDPIELKSHFLDPSLYFTIKTHSQVQENYCWLLEHQPQYIILYDADVELIRNIESYQSTIDDQIQLYFLVYEGSTEEHRYVGSLAKEKKSFETLITAKEHLVVSLPDNPLDLQKERENDTTISGDSRTIMKALKLKQKEHRKIVVDVREFRSTLPSILYSSQFQIIPRTINVGDYILSPEICVERKGISDLFQSFASGRLYNQVESMSRYYKYPCVLIEFTPDKPFGFMASNEVGTEIQSNSIISKLVLLTQSFPNLKLLWSKSPENTTDIFKAISLNHDEVDVQKALQVGAMFDRGDGIGSEGVEDQGEYGNSNNDMEQDARTFAQEILMSLPGINVHNCREVMKHVDNIAQLSNMSERDLSPLIGPGNAKKLVHFFRQKVM